jgi:hyperosmotically inducible protein
MKAHGVLTTLAAAALLMPVAGYSADVKDTAAPKTESAKEYVSDATITAKIKTEFAADKQVSAMKIKVDTDHGVVRLSGNAATKDEVDRAVAIAKGTKGVASVTNDIQVGGSGAKY